MAANEQGRLPRGRRLARRPRDPRADSGPLVCAARRGDRSRAGPGTRASVPVRVHACARTGDDLLAERPHHRAGTTRRVGPDRTGHRPRARDPRRFPRALRLEVRPATRQHHPAGTVGRGRRGRHRRRDRRRRGTQEPRRPRVDAHLGQAALPPRRPRCTAACCARRGEVVAIDQSLGHERSTSAPRAGRSRRSASLTASRGDTAAPSSDTTAARSSSTSGRSRSSSHRRQPNAPAVR